LALSKDGPKFQPFNLRFMASEKIKEQFYAVAYVNYMIYYEKKRKEQAADRNFEILTLKRLKLVENMTYEDVIKEVIYLCKSH